MTTGPTSAVEVERKFSLDAGQELPSLAAIAPVGRVDDFDLTATYYDTLHFALTRGRQALRRRLGGDDAGWHVKLQGKDAEHRQEHHAPPDSPRLPAELRALVAGTLAGQALLPVAVLKTHRRQTELLDDAGRVVALVCEDSVKATAAGRTERWREAEVELAGAGLDLLDSITRVFAQAGIERSPQASKIGRTLGAALAADDARLAAVPTAGDTVLDYLSVQVGLLQAREAAVLADVPDAVHRSRVATRRLRSALRTFEPLFAPGSLRKLRSELRWHAAELGAPRDAEVLRDGLLAALDALEVPADAPEREQVVAASAATHAAAHAELRKTMAGRRYDRLHRAMETLLVAPPFVAAAGEPATAVLHGLLDRARGRAAELHVHAVLAPDDLARWHEVRKAAKAVRYCSEALVEVYGARAEAQAAAWEAVTDAFGELQDSVVARATVSGLAAQATAAGRPLAAFDSLLAFEVGRGRSELARGREALAAALESSL